MSKLSVFAAFILSFFIMTTNATNTRAQGGHEYAPLTEHTINYKDWTFKSLKDDQPINLREWSTGKRLVLVAYLAVWCPNWRYEAPVVARLYNKYKAHGFDVIGVSEYAPTTEARAFFGEGGAPYTVVVESESREARTKTTHYTYRQSSRDARTWGSPYNIFFEPAKLIEPSKPTDASKSAKSGDGITEKAFVVNGELVEAEVEKFVRERLGLDKADKNESDKQDKNQAASPTPAINN